MNKVFRLQVVDVVKSGIVVQSHIQRYGWFNRKWRSIQLILKNKKKYVVVAESGQFSYYLASPEIIAFLEENKYNTSIDGIDIEEDFYIDVDYLLDINNRDKQQLNLQV